MRKFGEATGMKTGEGFYEALNRIEKGEDPEKVEEEMGGCFNAGGIICR